MTLSPFLTADELLELTGYKLAAKQCAWLTRNAFPFVVNAAGRPVVSRSAAEDRSSGREMKKPVVAGSCFRDGLIFPTDGEPHAPPTEDEIIAAAVADWTQKAPQKAGVYFLIVEREIVYSRTQP